MNIEEIEKRIIKNREEHKKIKDKKNILLRKIRKLDKELDNLIEMKQER